MVPKRGPLWSPVLWAGASLILFFVMFGWGIELSAEGLTDRLALFELHQIQVHSMRYTVTLS